MPSRTIGWSSPTTTRRGVAEPTRQGYAIAVGRWENPAVP